MTQKEFKEGLLRGQGRCIQAVQANPDKYYNLILWACRHEISFDAQCEGTRAWYVYQLINCHQNKASFLEAAVQSFESTKSDGGWKMLYLSELLYRFSCDGEDAADKALWCKYEKLYGNLMTRKRRPSGLFHERDDFVMLCQVLAEDKAAFIKIAEDIGRLYCEKSFYDGFDFDWLYESKGKRHRSTLTKLAKKSINIEQYLRVSQEFEQEWVVSRESRTENTSKKGIALSRWLKREADKDTVLYYAHAYIEQSDFEARAEALTAFSRCPYPENPSPIIEDTKSGCERLKEVAWQALENIRHPMVREFALKNLKNNLETVLPVFIKNYQEQDATLLESLVKSIYVDFDDTTGWHGVYYDVLRMVYDGLKASATLIQHIYETTYCSCCRERAFLQMRKRRMLTNEILQECLLDSNDDIRTYANQCLKKRKQ
jgi:hypothetical protein